MQNTKLRDCIVANETELTYDRLKRYKRPKTKAVKLSPVDTRNVEQIKLVIRNRENADLPNIDPTQHAPDPYFIEKLGYVYETLYEHRDCFINRRGVITTKQCGGMYRTKQLCDVIDLKSQSTS